MMQSQGLGALMPQAAQQMAPQQADPQRLAAATNLVSSDAERQILDPRTLALIKYKDALQAMQAADQMMAAAQPAPMPPTVAERTKLAAEQGIAGLASKLGAGIQQQGNNMQAQQMQQAMSGGLPQLPAPNMAGMAQGGIVGFQAGGRPEDTSLTDEQLAAILARSLIPGSGESVVQAAIESGVGSRQTMDGANSAALRRLLSETSRTAAEEDAAQTSGAQPTELETTSVLQDAPSEVGTFNVNPRVNFLGDRSAATPAPAEQSSRYTEQLEAMLEQIQGKTFDEEAAADARAAELRRLTGADDLVAQRAEAERRRRELAETRFSPEAQRRRALRAGLAGLAERGLGGFSSGAGAEDERIYAEQAAESERSVAEMDRLIADFRQMGMTEFEARNAARTAVQGQEQTQRQQQADVLSTLSEGQDAALGRAIQREQIAAQERTGMAQVNRPTDAMNEINIRADAAMAADPGLNRTDALKRAVDERVAADIRVQLASMGVREGQLNAQVVKDATDMAAAKLKNRMDLLTDPDAYNDAFDTELKNAIELIRSEMGQGRSTGGIGGGASTGLESVPDDELFR